MFDDFLDFLKSVYIISYIVCVIGLLAMPACVNHNMDVNKMPQEATITTQQRTRFSYKQDLLEPLAVCCGLVAILPVTATAVVYGDYRIYTNKLQVNPDGTLQ